MNLGRFFSFLIFYTVGGTPWTGDRSAARPLPTLGTTQTRNKRTQHPYLKWDSTHDPSVQTGEAVHALDELAHLQQSLPLFRIPGSGDITSRCSPPSSGWKNERNTTLPPASTAFFLGFLFHLMKEALSELHAVV
jgi:hypothetical protein